MTLSERMICYLEQTGVKLFYSDQDGMPVILTSNIVKTDGEIVTIRLSGVQLDFLGKHRNGTGVFTVEPTMAGSSKAPFRISGEGKITGSNLHVTVSELDGGEPPFERFHDTLERERMDWSTAPSIA